MGFDGHWEISRPAGVAGQIHQGERGTCRILPGILKEIQSAIDDRKTEAF
jgi:hypothetical protein